MGILGKSGFFSGGLETPSEYEELSEREKEEIVGGVKVYNELRELETLRGAIINFLGITRVFHNRNVIGVFVSDSPEIKDLNRCFYINDSEHSYAYKFYSELENKTLSSLYKEYYDYFSGFINDNRLISTIEFMVLNNFKRVASSLYKEGVVKSSTKTVEDYLLTLARLQVIAEYWSNGISMYLHSKGICLLPSMNLEKSTQDYFKSGEDQNDDIVITLSKHLVKIIDTDDFKSSKYYDSASIKLRGILLDAIEKYE